MIPIDGLLTLTAGPYTAKILPSLGGQVLSLCKNGVPILHEPENEAILQQKSTWYGLPILFPPNRIDGGKFETRERAYSFPVNEPNRGNSLHGFLHSRPWQVKEQTENSITLTYCLTPEGDFYEYYPHPFYMEQRYELSEEGLKQELVLRNTGEETMPVGLGQHSAFYAPKPDRIYASVGKRILMSERMLPTGKVRELNEDEKRFREGGMQVDAWAMDDHYTVEPLLRDGKPFHGAIIEREAGTVYYEVDSFYQHWMIWNAEGKNDFICIEPQNWRVNAPNLVSSGMSKEEAGFTELAPEQELHIFTKLSME